MKPTLAANSPRQMQTPFASVRNGRVCSSPFTRSAAEKTLHAMHVQYSMQPLPNDRNAAACLTRYGDTARQ
jgi:hypothetical protein